MPIPPHPKIYHIVHVDRLASILQSGFLLCDASLRGSTTRGTGIGMGKIKRRRLEDLTLTSHPALRVGGCVPFYFCARSIMLYLLHKANHPELSYRGGQDPIVHLEADLFETVAWADSHGYRWAFTLSNAGTYYFEDRADLDRLDELDWKAIQATDWREHKEGKQAEFLIEERFPWRLVSSIGVRSRQTLVRARRALAEAEHLPSLGIRSEWYY